MQSLKVLIAVLALSSVAACTTLSEQDRATLVSASENAQAARQQATQALQAAQQAQASAAAAAADAKAANEKADRMFQRTLRK